MKKTIKSIKKKVISRCFSGTGSRRPAVKNKKVLVVATDALGDVVVKDGLYKLICEKHGRENVVFMVSEKWRDVIERFGYKVFHAKRKNEKYGLLPRVRLIKTINKEKFGIIYNLEVGDPEIPMDHLCAGEKIGFVKESDEKHFDKAIGKGKEYPYIIDKLWEMGRVIDEGIDRKEIVPDLRDRCPAPKILEGISFGIGASYEKKIAVPEKSAEMIRWLLNEFPREKIYLLGSGKKQKEYAKKLTGTLRDERVVDLVDEVGLLEVIERINCSKFFLGFDSGLYNIAYALGKKCIAVFGGFGGFAHREKNVVIIGAAEKLVDT